MDLEERLRRKNIQEQRAVENAKEKSLEAIGRAADLLPRLRNNIGKFGLLIELNRNSSSFEIRRPGETFWVDTVATRYTTETIERMVEEIVLKYGETPGFFTSPALLFLRDALGRIGKKLDR